MLWEYIDSLSNASDIILKTFLALFLWETDANLYPILVFGVAYFAAIPIASLIGGALSNSVAPKIAMLSGIWMQVTQIILIILLANSLDTFLLIFIGIIGGLGKGFKNVAIRDIADQTRPHDNEAKYYAGKSIQYQLLNLFIPLACALIIGTGTSGYLVVFEIAIFILIAESFLTSLVQVQNLSTTFRLKEILTIPGTNPSKLTLIKGIFLEGLSEGVTLTIVPIITLVFVGSIINWGILNTALVLISILAGIVIGQIIDDINSKSLYAVGALIYASTCLFFISRYNFYILAIFLVARTLMFVIKNAGYYGSIDKIMSQDSNEAYLYSEYQFLIDLVTSVARLIPLVILILLNINIKDETIIRSVLIILGLIPLFTLSMLGRTSVFNKATRA
ncbi:hypothetical protein CO058_02450 [candidate division WWE3 bacterium CG_4_9_14_0_2_um_filter_35_11]|uniref:Major facilitator superfamily (MFS) profile domain-containing protein n=1 Tax=candidate division WWE3 bacterium CG_4_9_14_0_2_um_filter_35_11 TaxID=1975077 RepID=A0A2M8ELK3_UNCKA|nr:MAG: hypothetical protein COV25_02710 [candidate division WWE3 bacterium CG10_big_fil_rev_8_21_14_0_10_35_32]PJC23595.1 MAG: hypothetical protein CO058_02450 [candidate division WWE3 bacterium CG_4_9_14_0_2_um_filter_35_11]